MPFTSAEFETIIADQSKTVEGDLAWLEDEDHSPAFEFCAEVRSEAGWPLFLRGSYNPLAKALSFALILKTVGRIYGIDLGKAHHNPSCETIKDTHKHRWTEADKDKQAYVPQDVTAMAGNPVEVWRQFCTEANITHYGRLASPPSFQKELFL